MNDTRARTSASLPTADPLDAGLSPVGLDRLSALMRRETDAARVPGVAMAIARGGKIAYRYEAGTVRPGGPALRDDAIFRIYSMTKPIVSIALMSLVEEGRLFINDPIGKFVPELANVRVGVERNGKLETVAAERAITIQDLLRHTSGLTYGFTGDWAVQRLYKTAQVFTDDPANARTFLTHDETSAEFITALAKLPLIDQPGASWNYGHSTDVIGRVIEVITAQRLGAFVKDRVLAPLRMDDTAFFVPPEKYERLAEPLPRDPDAGAPVELIEMRAAPRFESGGGGLFSTMDDYMRFALMLYGGGALGGTRIIGRKTLAFMTADHLAPEVRIPPTPLLPPGHGFGLGFAVRREEGMAPTPGTPGEFFWGGVAGTYFWVAPKEELVALLLVQAPRQRDYYRTLFRNLVHAALA